MKEILKKNKLLIILAVTAIICSSITYNAIIKAGKNAGPDPSEIISLILVDLVLFLVLGIVIARKLFRYLFSDKQDKSSSKLQNRIIAAFSIVATIPTIIVSVFSAYFFNFGVQSWFDKKISAVLDQSIIVAESYIAEHTIGLKSTAISMAEDLNDMHYYNLLHDSQKFGEALNAEAEMRSLDEAMVYNAANNSLLAQTPLSFSLSFTSIPVHLIERANQGYVVEIKTDPTKIKMLIKLKEYENTYLLISRLIDKKIIDHVDKTNGAAEEYQRLRDNISNMQIKFSVSFILVALLLLLAAISWAIVFASQIVKPIKNLVSATDKVKDGDLTVQIPEENLNKDEIKILTRAFNRMIKQIDRQQKDLVVAQRALAWSDVARRVAHEIKNPLTPIHLSAERLLKKFEVEVEDKVSFKKYVQTIIRHTNDIKKIVAEFVNFARLPSPVFIKFDVISVVKDLVDSRKIIYEKIEYIFQAENDRIEFVGDITQINQVMINLLKNAEESLENSADPHIIVHISEYENLLEITIEDNGKGFTDNLLHKATDAYITTSNTGMGLGLAIVKKIVQDHYGLIELGNNSIKGATIKLIFDIEKLKFKLT